MYDRQRRALARRDRCHGAGLPAALGTENYQRIADALARRGARLNTPQGPYARQAMQPRTAAASAPKATPVARRKVIAHRVRDVASIERAGFRRLASGVYKKGHASWELRAAEDTQLGGDYLLVRKHEEHATDMRAAGASGPSNARQAQQQRQANRRLGRVFAVRNGQVEAGALVEILEDVLKALVEFDDGEQELLPMDDLLGEAPDDEADEAPELEDEESDEDEADEAEDEESEDEADEDEESEEAPPGADESAMAVWVIEMPAGETPDLSGLDSELDMGDDIAIMDSPAVLPGMDF